MKMFIGLLLLFPSFLFAQDCKVKKVTDQFSQLPKMTTGFITLSTGSDQVRYSIESNDKEIDFMFSLADGEEKCFDNASNVTLFYEGTRSKSNYKNTGSMNCNGLFHFTFRNVSTTPSALNQLITRKVVKMVFTTTDKKELTIELTPEETKQFSDAVACLVKEAKSLIK